MGWLGYLKKRGGRWVQLTVQKEYGAGFYWGGGGGLLIFFDKLVLFSYCK